MAQENKNWDHTQEELERSRQKIAAALKSAKEISKKNSCKRDDIDTKFHELQVLGVELLEILRDSGTDRTADWLYLTERLCQLLQSLECSVAFKGSTDEREIRQKDLLYRQKSMMNLTRIIGRKLLFEGKHYQAVSAAIQSLRFSIDTHGLNSVNLVPSYIILGEASIGLRKLKQADEYLSQAEWTVLKSTDATDGIKSTLYRNLGLLYAAKGDYDYSLRMFSEDIYHASKEWGTVDIHTAGGYFHMANVFFRQNKKDVADSLYSQVTDIWFDFLNEFVKKKTERSKSLASLLGLSGKEEAQAKVLDEVLEVEATHMLNAVYEIREQSAKPNYAATSKICHTLSMLYFMLDDITKAQEMGKRAISASEQLPSRFVAPLNISFLPPMKCSTASIVAP